MVKMPDWIAVESLGDEGATVATKVGVVGGDRPAAAGTTEKLQIATFNLARPQTDPMHYPSSKTLLDSLNTLRLNRRDQSTVHISNFEAAELQRISR